MEEYYRQRLICPVTTNPGFLSAHEGQLGNQHGMIHRGTSLKQDTLDGTANYGKSWRKSSRRVTSGQKMPTECWRERQKVVRKAIGGAKGKR